ncbi:MAG: hypothetical protein HY885_00235 [Deltaproteobacteria bacterium]|nr:hypothetical protein [Deltaproteobacteria bacterium]
MFTINELYFGRVEQKLSRAHQLHAHFGQKLLALPAVKEKLPQLETLSHALQRQMAAMSMFSLCRACGEKAGGGCCSAYMANETDAVLLLLNMLLGVTVASQRRDDSCECCYLGLQGCTLRVKPIFCLNYNCRHILTGNEASVLQNLETAASAVLRAQTALEEIILGHIRSA